MTKLLLTLLMLGSSCAAEPTRPNIVLIFADDLGYGDLGCYGSGKIKTPHLDALARDGLRFTSFYAQAVCGPSRAALMTGCYPVRVGEPDNKKNAHTVLHAKEITMAEVLRDAGYATACIGKWHLGAHSKTSPTGFDPATMPNAQGFDEFYGTPLYNGYTVKVADAKFRSTILRNEEVVVPAVESWDQITQDYTRESLDFIRRHREKPFFLYLAHNMPHIPVGASERFKGKSAGGPYGDAVEEIDWSCGEIVKMLRELGLAENTLVVFTSDNGPWIETTHGMKPNGKRFIPRDHSGSADPLRGYKMLTWEGGLRVPCIAWWPGKIPAGTESDAITSTIDLMPTFAALAGGKVPDDRIIDGRDLRALLQGPVKAASPHDAFFYYCHTHLQAVRSGKWKFVRKRPEHPPWVGFSGRFAGNAVEELSLYDLDNDIGETTNVAAGHPEVLARLRQLAHEARMDLGDYDHTGSGARFFDGPAPERKAGGGGAAKKMQKKKNQ
ncbi:sulfatase [Prosthecobacter sp. SYSU 5D2]|uniref:sulfatase family protein n=1 Tax=Prosthecobacter sp. SYSU 5D2 TaxID=3134134 RepID=UPI0031FECE1E